MAEQSKKELHDAQARVHEAIADARSRERAWEEAVEEERNPGRQAFADTTAVGNSQAFAAYAQNAYQTAGRKSAPSAPSMRPTQPAAPPPSHMMSASVLPVPGPPIEQYP